MKVLLKSVIWLIVLGVIVGVPTYFYGRDVYAWLTSRGAAFAAENRSRLHTIKRDALRIGMVEHGHLRAVKRRPSSGSGRSSWGRLRPSHWSSAASGS